MKNILMYTLTFSLLTACYFNNHLRIDIDPHRDPAVVMIPDDYKSDQTYPLVLLLHGYSMNDWMIDLYTGLSNQVDERQMILLIPNGRKDTKGKKYWNAGSSCCDLDGQANDDQSYLTNLIAEAKKHYNIDEEHVYLIGFSNGAFMAYQLACNHSTLIAGAAGFAGTMAQEHLECPLQEGLSFLHIHGLEDDIIPYHGGTFKELSPHASVDQLMQLFTGVNNCLAGPDHQVLQANWYHLLSENNFIDEYTYSCERGQLRHWKMHGAGHRVFFKQQFSSQVLERLLWQSVE